MSAVLETEEGGLPRWVKSVGRTLSTRLRVTDTEISHGKLPNTCLVMTHVPSRSTAHKLWSWNDVIKKTYQEICQNQSHAHTHCIITAPFYGTWHSVDIASFNNETDHSRKGSVSILYSGVGGGGAGLKFQSGESRPDWRYWCLPQSLQANFEIVCPTDRFLTYPLQFITR